MAAKKCLILFVNKKQKLGKILKGVTTIQNKRLKNKNSILVTVTDLQEKHHLPVRREPIRRVPATLPPHLNILKPEIKGALLDNSKKSSNPVGLKFSALETIDSYPLTWIHSYTDGSAFKGTVNAGYGSVIRFPDGVKKEVYNSNTGRTSPSFLLCRDEGINSNCFHMNVKFFKGNTAIKNINTA